FLLACMAAATTGSMFQPGAWYESLVKPSWTPPKWMFPVAWTVLYVLMSIAGARVVDLPGSGTVLAFWALQIALNTLWTPVFFGLRNMAAGMIIIVGLWIAVAATMVGLFLLDTWAGMMFLPYLLWVSIASALNYSVWKRNPEVKPISGG
ncbi:MAG: tryptophan-rich sensory protein, partial [Rhodobacteraceae bacterium]|nr:tryptophan-rich sensory protein [Paracoccaceae bacterium]